jgi:hypothetical protein
MIPKMPRTNYANVTATLALFVALSGGAYAATILPANSVGARQIKRDAVERGKIKNRAVDSAKVLDGSLTGADISEGTLGKVPFAAAADTATNAVNATHASTSAAIDKLTYKSASASAPATTDSTAATASCDAGQRATGGGVKLDNPAAGLVDDSYPDGNAAWTAHVYNPSGSAQNFTVYVICTAAATVG